MILHLDILLELTGLEKYNWDRAIEKGDNKFNMEEHNIFLNNCPFSCYLCS